MELYMKRKSKIMAHIRCTRHIMMPTHRDYFDYSYFFPASIIAD
ncbi:leader peptide SpeFL [Shewanella algae]